MTRTGTTIEYSCGIQPIAFPPSVARSRLLAGSLCACVGDAFNHDVCLMKHAVLPGRHPSLLGLRLIVLDEKDLDDYETSLIDARRTVHGSLGKDPAHGCNRKAGSGTLLGQKAIDAIHGPDTLTFRAQLGPIYSIFSNGDVLSCGSRQPRAFTQISEHTKHNKPHTNTKQATHTKATINDDRQAALDPRAP